MRYGLTPHRDGRRIAARWLTSDPVFGIFEKQRVIEEDAVAKAQASSVAKSDVDISVVQNLSLLSKIYSDVRVLGGHDAVRPRPCGDG